MESKSLSLSTGDQLRKEERIASLGLEKSLCNYHALLQVSRDALEASGQQKASDRLDAAMWHIAGAVEELVKRRNGF